MIKRFEESKCQGVKNIIKRTSSLFGLVEESESDKEEETKELSAVSGLLRGGSEQHKILTSLELRQELMCKKFVSVKK